MKITSNGYLPALCLTAIASVAGPVQAETLAYIGATATSTAGTNNPGEDDRSMTSIGLDGLVTYGFGNGTTLVFEGTYNSNESEDDLFFGESAGDDAELAIHVLYDLRPGLTLGGFVSTGFAESEVDNDDERYPFNAVGVSGSYVINDQFSSYAQYAVVEQPDFDNLSSGGYNDGYAARIGVSYAINDRNTVYLDAQYGEAVDYEDDDEDGVFERYAIGGETMIGNGTWAVNYEISKETYNAEEDDNIVETTNLTLGARYYFGGATGSELRNKGMIGTPDIIRRASLFTGALD